MSAGLRRLAWAVLALALLAAAVWLGLPPLLKWQLETRGSALLGREIRVEELRFAPTTLALTLQGLSIGAAPGSADTGPQLQVERLMLDFDARSLWRLAPVIGAVDIEAPRLRLARLAEGQYDIDDLLQRFAAPAGEPASPPQRFALFNLRVVGGQISVDDRPVGQRHELRNINLGLPFLSNLPDDLEIKVEPQLAFELNGSSFDTRGRSTPFAEGRASEFDIRFEQLALTPAWAYLPKSLPLRPAGGALWADLKLRFEQHRQTGVRINLQGRFELRDMALQLPDGEPLLAWQSLRVQLADVQPLRRRIELESLQIDGAVLHARRDGDGALQLARLAESGSSAAAPVATAASAPVATPKQGEWQLQLPLLELKQAQVQWHDAAVQPTAMLTLDGIDLRLQELRWPVEADASLRLDARVMAAGEPAGQLHAEGAFTDQRAQVAVQASELDLRAAAPYLRQWLRPQASGSVNAAGELQWATGGSPRLALALSKLSVEGFALRDGAPPSKGRKGGASADLLSWRGLIFTGVQADVLQRRLSIDALSLQQPEAALARNARGEFDAEQWLLGPADATAEPAAASAPPWRVKVERFQLDDGRLRLSDATLAAGPLEFSALRARASSLSWPVEAGAPAIDNQVSASLTVAGASRGTAPARLDWRGRIDSQPLAARGRLRVERLPVHAFEPLFGAGLLVKLQRAEAGFSGAVDLKRVATTWQGRVQGEALLADVRIDARQSDAARSDTERELASWNAMSLQGLVVEFAAGSKPRVVVEQLRLSAYYAQLEITEEGRLYLQTLAPGDSGGAAPAAAAAPAASGAAPARVSRTAALPFQLQLGGAVFTSGRVEFIDRFIQPNYSAELSDLYGRIGAFDTSATLPATLQFSGVVAGTGVLSIEGEVNPTIEPPALDVRAKATGIELPGLTPYAAKYAGYPIERGKLSVDVAYKIDPDGKLEASNKIVVNQLTFGEKSDSPEATTLPVRLAVALLQDRYGVIDIDLPVSGSINDPQFSIGGLILKAIVNLLTKVLTAPFSVLAGGGGGPDLSVIEFAPGSTSVDAAGQKVVDQVALALADRPMLKLSITGTADAAGEKPAMQRAALQSRLLEEQRRERARGALDKADALDAPLPPLSAEARAALIKKLYVATALPGKPAGAPGTPADLPPAEMQARLAAAVPVDEAAVRQLSLQRARAVREALVAKGMDSERLFLVEPQAKAGAADNLPPRPTAQLSLSPL